MLRKRWWLLLPILAISGMGAYQAAEEWGSESSITTAAVIHRGLPGVPGPTVYEPLGPKTCSEMLTSHNVLKRVLAERNLPMPTAALADLIRVEQTRNSSLINVELSWGDQDDAIELLNDLLEGFIEHVAATRRETLREHLTHVELASLEARTDVERARSRLDQLRRRQQQAVIDGGGGAETTYAELLSNVSKTRDAIDDEQAARVGIQQQLAQLTEKQTATREELESLQQDAIDKLLRETTNRLASVRESYSSTSSTHREITKLIDELGEFGSDGGYSVSGWIAEMTSKLAESPARIASSTLTELSEAYTPILDAHESAADEVKLRLRDVERTLDSLRLRVFPVDSKIRVMEQRLEELQAETSRVDQPLAGFELPQIDEATARLEEAEEQQQLLALQLANMRQLEKCRVNEWTISVPASRETSQVSTNATKIGALVFGLSTVGLCVPLVLAEWLGRRKPPHVEFAQSAGLPLIADGVLNAGRSGTDRYRSLDDRSRSEVEGVRRVALWIQQSCERQNRGAIVVFSALDQRAAAPGLMQSIAQCLAEREERVLLVNAVSSDRTDGWVAAEPGEEGSQRRQAKGHREPRAGLAEYLAAECPEESELIRPTGIRGVDAMESGKAPLPREAMASSCLSKLLESCSDRYSVLLVNGPSAQQSADLQMLAAHANGIVLTASRQVARDPAAHAAIAELNELQAPIIGLIS